MGKTLEQLRADRVRDLAAVVLVIIGSLIATFGGVIASYLGAMQ